MKQASDSCCQPWEIRVDGSSANMAQNMRWRGLGMVSGNNSSRLLLDYKAEQPEAYWAIMRHIFGAEGLAMAHLKVEMGADINSSSGTEPSVKRTAEEPADVTRGAAYQIAADAKRINPELTLDMLWWSEPKWVSAAADVYAARYRWYKETLDAAWNTYGLRFDCVSAVQNERAIDAAWIKYLAAHLKAEADCPYDYGTIKIVAGDEVCTWVLADMMLADAELRDAVDIVGSHYTSWSTDNAQKLTREYGKELWFSEACPSMSYAPGVCRHDGKASGLADVGGTLDIANRIITMYPGGRMTLCEIQPVVAAYYDGVTYCSKQLILANEPWSGAYTLDSSFYMMLHFARFIRKGWAPVDSACHADGKAGGGDGHAVVDAQHSYVTAMDPDTGDFSTVLTNTTGEELCYRFMVSGLGKAGAPLHVWETRGADAGAFDENYFKKQAVLTPVEENGQWCCTVTLRPWSVVTVSTVDAAAFSHEALPSQVLALPYADDYRYADYPGGYLTARGQAPRYTTDEGGAFEVREIAGKPVLMQLITLEDKAEEWGATPNPVTNFGDDRWFNYSVSADVLLAPEDADGDVYAGVGLRYTMGGNGESGYWVRLQRNGCVSLMKNAESLCQADLADFVPEAWHRIKIEAVNDSLTAWVDGQTVLSRVCENEGLIGAGRAALYSSYHHSCFAQFAAEPAEGHPAYVTRYDDMDGFITFRGEWDFTTTGGWKSLRRTSSTGAAGAEAVFSFEGTGFLLLGDNEAGTVLEISIDGQIVEAAFTTMHSEPREAFYHSLGLSGGRHDAVIRVFQGRLNVDGIEIVAEGL